MLVEGKKSFMIERRYDWSRGETSIVIDRGRLSTDYVLRILRSQIENLLKLRRTPSK